MAAETSVLSEQEECMYVCSQLDRWPWLGRRQTSWLVSVLSLTSPWRKKHDGPRYHVSSSTPSAENIDKNSPPNDHHSMRIFWLNKFSRLWKKEQNQGTSILQPKSQSIISYLSHSHGSIDVVIILFRLVCGCLFLLLFLSVCQNTELIEIVLGRPVGSTALVLFVPIYIINK